MIRHKKCFVLFVLFLLLFSQLLVFEFGFVPSVNAEGGRGIVVPQLVSQSYLIPIVNGVINDVQVYASNVSGYRLYNALISIDITWDGANAVDYLSSYNFLNWIWHLQQKSGTAWNEVKPTSMTITASQDENGCYVTRMGTLADGSTFTIKYSLPNDGALKFSLSYTPAKTASYKLWFEVSGLQDGNTNAYVNYSKPNAKKVHFVLPSYIGMMLDFDYSDVSASLTQSEQFDLTNFKYNYYVELGNLKAGTVYTVDPTTVSTAAGQYSTALGNSRKLFRDAYGKYIAVYKNTNVRLGYCNNDPPTSGWSDNDLGATYAVGSGEQFGVAAAYDSTNDKLMVGWVGSLNLKLAQITFTRDANHNITGYTAGSVLSIAPAYVNTHNPSLWMLHNGEVACVWGDDKTSGAKHSVVKFCRVVFGSPPTYKNAAGTASSVDTISSDYTSNFIIRYQTIVERINAGTGQYDLFAFFSASDYLLLSKKGATWSSPNWSWGNGATAVSLYHTLPFAGYDTFNGLVVYGAGFTSSDNLVVHTINASDTDTDISPTSILCDFGSLAIDQNNGDYYVFHNAIYYIKRSSGSWGSDTLFFTDSSPVYPSCKVDGAGNKIELIWTHYTGSAYNVYYDYLNLATGQTYTRSATQTLPVSPTATRTGSFQRSLTQIFQFLGAATRAVTFMRQVLQFGSIQAVANGLQTFARSLAQPFSLLGSPTRTLTNIRQPSQTVTLQAVASRIATLFRTSTMISQVSAFTTAQKTVARLATLTLTPTAFAERILQLQRSTSQLVQLLITAQKTVSLPRQVTQNLILNFIQTRALTTARNPAGVLNIVSQVMRQVTVTRLQPQNIILTALANRFATFPRTASQTVSVLTTNIRNLNLPRALSETVNMQAFSSTLRTFSRLQPQTFKVESTVLRVLSASRTSVSQVFLAMAAQKGAMPFERTVSLMVTIASQLTRTTTMLRPLAETLLYQTVVSRQTVSTRILSQAFTMVTATSRSLTMPRLAEATASIASSISRSLMANRQAPTTILTQLLTARTLNIQRQTDQPFSLNIFPFRTANILRLPTQPFSIFATSLRSLTGTRQTSQTFTLIPSTIRTLSAQRQAFQSFSISSLTSRLASLARTQIQQFTFVLSVSRTQTFARLVSETITSQASAIRWQQLLRQANIPFHIMSTAIGEKAGFYERLISQAFLILPSTARSIVSSRQAAQQFLLLTFTSRSAQPTRLIIESIETLATTLRTIQATRTAPLNVILAFQGARTAQFTRVNLQSLIMNAIADRLLLASRTATSQFTILLSVTSQKTTFGILRSADLSITVNAIAQRTHVGMARTANALFQAIVSVSRQVIPLSEGYIPSGPISTPNFEITVETFSFSMNTFANQLTTKTIIKFQPLDAFNGNVTLNYWITDYSGATRLAYENMTIQLRNTDRDPTLYTLTLSTTIFWTAVTNDHLIWHLNAEYNGITTGEIRVLFTPIPWLTQLKPFWIYFLIVAILLICYWIFFKSD